MVALKLQLLAIATIFVSLSGQALTDTQVMRSARLDFAKGNFSQAIKSYTLIPASSDFWLDSVEERAWAHTRQGQFERALGDLQTVTSAVWSSQVSPETYVLSTFVSLKICAYKDVVKKIELFKKRMLPRVDALEKLVAEPLTSDFWKLAEPLEKGEVTMVSLGTNTEKFPRYFFRDKQVIDALKSKQRSRVEDRMKQLAKNDLAEISLNLKKMKIIDVEIMQKILMTDELHKVQNSNLKFSTVDRDQQLIFPVTDDEVWVDEVGHFQVKADTCPTLAKGTL